MYLPNCVEDVQRCMQVASYYQVPLTVKSGGHCFGGYSTIDSRGFVVALSNMKAIEWSDASVKTQAGALWNDVCSQMDDSVLVVGAWPLPFSRNRRVYVLGTAMVCCHVGLALLRTMLSA